MSIKRYESALECVYYANEELNELRRLLPEWEFDQVLEVIEKLEEVELTIYKEMSKIS